MFSNYCKEHETYNCLAHDNSMDHPKQLTNRDFAGALGHAETAIDFAIHYLEKKDNFEAMRVLKTAKDKIQELAPLDIEKR